MELLLFRYSEWAQLYNCTGVLEVLPVSFPVEKRTSPALGWSIITLSSIYLVKPQHPGWSNISQKVSLCPLLSIWGNRTGACYKFMLYIGVVDMAQIVCLGIFTGIFILEGTFFCQRPVLMYVVGAFIIFLWVAESTADAVMALNRCIDLLASKWSKRLFRGNRTCCWLALITAYAFYCFAFTRAAVFIPVYSAWFFDPFFGQTYDPFDLFLNWNVYVQDIVAAFGTLAFYSAFLVAWAKKVREDRKLVTSSTSLNAIDHMQKIIFLQVLAVSALNTVTGLMYTYMEIYGASNFVMLLGYFCWLHIHCLPPVIYLALNKSIRNDCKAYLKRMLGVGISNKGSGINTVAPVVPLTALNAHDQHNSTLVAGPTANGQLVIKSVNVH